MKVKGNPVYAFFLYLQVELQSRTAFEMLRIAEDLEIRDLQLACEQYFMDNLSVENAAEFLADAMAISRGLGAGGVSSLVEKCVGFMEENAEEVVKTQGFLLLPKPAMIRLVSSDQVTLFALCSMLCCAENIHIPTSTSFPSYPSHERLLGWTQSLYKFPFFFNHHH